MLLSTVEAASEAAMADVNSGLAEALSNQKKIEHDTRQVQLQSAQLTKSARTRRHTDTTLGLLTALAATRTELMAVNVCRVFMCWSRQMDRWVAMYGGLNSSVKELGDLSNWAGSLQADMDGIASALNRLMAARQQQRRGEEDKRRAAQSTVSSAVVSAALPDARAKPQPI